MLIRRANKWGFSRCWIGCIVDLRKQLKYLILKQILKCQVCCSYHENYSELIYVFFSS